MNFQKHPSTAGSYPHFICTSLELSHCSIPCLYWLLSPVCSSVVFFLSENIIAYNEEAFNALENDSLLCLHWTISLWRQRSYCHSFLLLLHFPSSASISFLLPSFPFIPCTYANNANNRNYSTTAIWANHTCCETHEQSYRSIVLTHFMPFYQQMWVIFCSSLLLLLIK